MKVKICGITRLEDALTCAEYGADAVGFIFYKKSKRYVDPHIVKEIVSNLPFFIQKVGVFVDDNANTINSISSYTGLTGIQLHGNEEPDFVDELNLPSIKALRVNNSFSSDILYRYKKTPILLDSYSKNELGGTGITFNWEIIPGELRKNIVLAGGVSIDNVEEIKKKINPYAVDISSSIEDSPGIKNKDKLIKILNKINELRK